MLCQKQKPQRFESEESCFCNLIRRFNVGHLWSSASDYRRNQIKQEVTITPPKPQKNLLDEVLISLPQEETESGMKRKEGGREPQCSCSSLPIY